MFENYEEGGTLNWAWEVPCYQHRSGVLLRLPDLRRILQRTGFRIRGGIIEISKVQFDQIEPQLLSSGISCGI